MHDWDAVTNMTEKEGQRAGRRVVDNRAKFMLEQTGKWQVGRGKPGPRRKL
jgi:hypothetical protein